MKDKIKSILTKIKNNKKKVIRITLGVFLTFIFTFTVYNMNNPTYFNRLFASIGSVPNEAFEDNDFYNCVIDSYNNANGTSKAYTDNLTDDELGKITSLTCESRGIESTKGIEKLTGLKYLDLNHNRLTNIDLSNNIALINLNLWQNDITSIDLSNNILLTNLDLSYNGLKNIDLSKNILLTSLNLTENYFLRIDLSNNTALTYLNLYAGQLTNIELGNNTAITELNLGGNRLTNVDLSNNILLISLDLSGNQLTNLDLSNNKKIENLDLEENQLSLLDLSNNTSLTSLNLGNNPLSEDILMQNGETYTIEEKIIPPSGQDFSYSVDDTSVASIQGNVVTALKEGTTTLKTKFGNFSFERKLVVGEVKLHTSDDYYIKINNEEKYIYLNYYNGDFDFIEINEFIGSNVGELVKEKDKLKVVLGSKVIAEYKLVYIEQAVDMNNNYLLLSLSVDKPNYINGVNCTYELLDNGNEIVVKYNGKEIDRKKLVYMYLPHKFNYFSEMLYISTVKEFNESMINNIDNVSQIDKNKINILNAKMVLKTDDGNYFTIDVNDKRITEFYGFGSSISDNYDLAKDYIYLGTNEFNNDIYMSFGDSKNTTEELLAYGLLTANDDIVKLGANDFIIDSWPLIKVTSDKYDMSGDKIDLKGEDIDLSKINVTNALLKVDNNKLHVMYNDEVVKEFKLENVKKPTATTKPSDEEKTTTTVKVTTKENKKTTTKETTTKKKESIIDKIFGKSETTTKKEKTTTTKKSIIVKRTNKTTKIESNSDTINNNSKNSINKIVTKSNILILLLSIMDIALIIYIVTNKKKINKK